MVAVVRTPILGGECIETLDVGIRAHATEELCGRWVEWSVTAMTLDGKLRLRRVMTGASV